VTAHEAELRKVLADYFDAIYLGDVHALRRAMHPRARLLSVTEGNLIELDLEQYVERIEGRVAPGARGDHRQDRIVSLSIGSATTAHARVQNTYLPRKFTDELTLCLVDGRWQILTKVWHFDV
jgi:hypothetical protein